jgi:iron complex transport system substrate-binding protein
MVQRTTVIVVLAVLPLLAACPSGSPVTPPVDNGPERLVSMAPSITEILYALELGDRVVGVTRYCQVPADQPVPSRVGGYVDPDWEALVGLRPDLVFTMESHAAAERRFADLGLKSVRVDQASVDGILNSFVVVADACGVHERGRVLRDRVASQLRAVRDRVNADSRPRVLVVIGREIGRGHVTSVWAAGKGSFYDDLLTWAGGVNALEESSVAYPELGPEGLLSLDPDVVLDIVADASTRGASTEAAVADWRSFASLRAVDEGRVHVLTGDALVIPGPRIGKIVEAFAEALHPLSGDA